MGFLCSNLHFLSWIKLKLRKLRGQRFCTRNISNALCGSKRQAHYLYFFWFCWRAAQLLPSEKVAGLIPGRRAFLGRGCVFSPCTCGFSLVTQTKTITVRIISNWIVLWCEGESSCFFSAFWNMALEKVDGNGTEFLKKTFKFEKKIKTVNACLKWF